MYGDLKINPEDVVLIDTNSMFRVSLQAPLRENAFRLNTRYIYSVMGYAWEAAKGLGAENVGVVFSDATFEDKRKKSKEYKTRHSWPSKRNKFEEQQEGARKILSAMGIPILEARKYETLDYIGSLLPKILNTGKNVVIISDDREALSFLDEEHGSKVRVYDPKNEVERDCSYVEKQYLVRPRQDALISVFAVIGSRSKNVNAAKIGTGVRYRHPFSEFGGFENYMSTTWQQRKAAKTDAQAYHRTRAKIRLIRRNLSVLAPKTDLPVPYEDGDLVVKEGDKEELSFLIRYYNFSELLALLENDNG